MDKKTLAILALLLTSVIWGITLPLMKFNLNTFPPLTLAFGRFLSAALIAVTFSELKNLKLKDFIHIGIFSFFGITLHIGLFLIGLSQTSAVDATVIMTLSPIFTSLMAVLVINEKINSTHLIGIMAAFTGTFFYILYPTLTGGQNFALDLRGDIFVLASVFSGAIYTLGSKKLFETYHPSSISSVSFVVGAISFFPGAVFEYFQNPSWVQNISTFNLFSIAFLGIFSSFIAYSALEWGLSKVPVHVDQTIGYLTPIISILISIAFLGEKLHIVFIVSVILIFMGMYLVTKYKPKTDPHFHQRIHKV